MAEYEKDKNFSWGWCVGGMVLMFITNWFGGFLEAGLGITSIWANAGISLAAFAIGGFVIGWQSEGRTIIEGGIAALLAIGVAVAIRGLPTIDPIALSIGFGIPFGAAILGAWIGELVQGNVIVTKDD
jgi:hypothetical protein